LHTWMSHVRWCWLRSRYVCGTGQCIHLCGLPPVIRAVTLYVYALFQIPRLQHWTKQVTPLSSQNLPSSGTRVATHHLKAIKLSVKHFVEELARPTLWGRRQCYFYQSIPNTHTRNEASCPVSTYSEPLWLPRLHAIDLGYTMCPGSCFRGNQPLECWSQLILVHEGCGHSSFSISCFLASCWQLEMSHGNHLKIMAFVCLFESSSQHTTLVILYPKFHFL
jgi:hypothetical protein